MFRGTQRMKSKLSCIIESCSLVTNSSSIELSNKRAFDRLKKKNEPVGVLTSLTNVEVDASSENFFIVCTEKSNITPHDWQCEVGSIMLAHVSNYELNPRKKMELLCT